MFSAVSHCNAQLQDIGVHVNWCLEVLVSVTALCEALGNVEIRVKL